MHKGGILLNRAGKGRYDAAREVGNEILKDLASCSLEKKEKILKIIQIL